MKRTTHNVLQGTPEWLALRAGYFTASEAPAMMGESKYQSRSELIRQKFIGIAPDVDSNKQRLFDAGHAAEDSARPLAQDILNDELYPVTMSIEVDGLKLLASLDGITMDESTVWEHKLANEYLIEAVEGEALAPHYYWQLEQELLVSGALRALFMCSDGTNANMAYYWYVSQPERRAALIGGWKQFAADLAAYQHVEIIPAAVAAPIKDLPAIVVTVAGSLAVETNFSQWGKKLTAFIARIPAKPDTDQDFADCKAAVAALKKAEAQLDAEESRVLSLVPSIDDMKREKKLLRDLSSTTRLALEKLVIARDTTLKIEIMNVGKDELAAHIASLNNRIGKPWMPAIAADWAEAIKGKKLYSAMRGAVSDRLAAKKIESSAIADRIELNLKGMAAHFGATDYDFLFRDLATLVLKAPDDFAAAVALRCGEHKTAEAKREEETRQRIAAEERAKIEAETRRAMESSPVHAVLFPPTEPATQPAAQAVQAPSGGKPQEPAVVAAIDTGATMTLGDINTALCLTVSSDLLAALGFQFRRDRSAKLYRAYDFRAICAALVRHIQAIEWAESLPDDEAPNVELTGVPPTDATKGG